MSHPITPEHLQLFSTRRLKETLAERVSTTDEEVSADAATADMARMARYEMRRRQGQVPVRNRYASVNVRTLVR